ncbi:MAG TPA: hypothetical protein VNG12_05645 [Acidimicrobiales bacterium]|nr:hypothetical protein [Acidimicrobiales bacterium]
MSLTIFLDVLILAYFLTRQLRVRIVPRQPRLQFPMFIGVLGLIELVSYTGDHPVTSSEYVWLLGTLLVGAVLLGALRALTVRIWVASNWVVRQGNWLTMALWALSIGLHFVRGSGTTGGGVESASLLLYFAVTYGVQNYVVHRRALPLWASLGPEAGARLRITFGQGPGTFFTTFGSGDSRFPPPPPRSRGSDVIDAEVVEDSEGPPELR